MTTYFKTPICVWDETQTDDIVKLYPDNVLFLTDIECTKAAVLEDGEVPSINRHPYMWFKRRISNIIYRCV